MLKTQEPQIFEEPKEYPVLTTVNGIQIVKYSEKSVAAIGETTPFKEAIKEAGGKWNSKLKCGPGWILSAKKLEALKTALSTTPAHTLVDPSPTLVRKVVRRKKVKTGESTHVKNEKVKVKVLSHKPSSIQLDRIESKLDMVLTLLETVGITLPSVSEPASELTYPPTPVPVEKVKKETVKKTRKKVVKRRKKLKKVDNVPETVTTEHLDQKPRKKLLGK